MAKETFGQRLAALRKEKGLTQNDIADKVGITAQAVSKWENDQASPDIDILIKLSEIFDISLDELLGKVKPSVSLNDKPTKKDINKMVLKISVNEVNGDKVKVNLPLALVKVFINKDTGEIPLLDGKESLKNIDFRQILDLVEQGVIGEIVSIASENGDKVSIAVE
ncbi:MAG: helix-turn-helix domain-containing protein [Erysipelotrichaceae bacterium]|jgi:transcriptional regulator with XRE-family HTH domain|nr:helix-turn-helix domain-containing protein [Erysipelotrichaceae bacterium]